MAEEKTLPIDELKGFIRKIAVSQNLDYNKFLEEIKPKYLEGKGESLDAVIGKEITTENFEDVKAIVESLYNVYRETFGSDNPLGSKTGPSKENVAIRFAVALILHRYHIEFKNRFKDKLDLDFKRKMKANEGSFFKQYSEKQEFISQIIPNNPFVELLFKRIPKQTEVFEIDLGKPIKETLRDFVDKARAFLPEDQQEELIDLDADDPDERTVNREDGKQNLQTLYDIFDIETPKQLFEILKDLIEKMILKTGDKSHFYGEELTELYQRFKYKEIQDWLDTQEDLKLAPDLDAVGESDEESDEEPDEKDQSEENQESEDYTPSSSDEDEDDDDDDDSSVSSDSAQGKELERLRARLTAQDKELEKLRAKLVENESQEPSALTGENEALKARNQELEDEAFRSQEKLNVLQASHDVLQQRADSLQEELDVLKASHAALEKGANDLQEELNKLQDTKAALEERADELQKENETLKRIQGNSIVSETSTPVEKSKFELFKDREKSKIRSEANAELQAAKLHFKKKRLMNEWLKDKIKKILEDNDWQYMTLDGEIITFAQTTKFEKFYKRYYGIEDQEPIEPLSPILKYVPESPLQKEDSSFSSNESSTGSQNSSAEDESSTGSQNSSAEGVSFFREPNPEFFTPKTNVAGQNAGVDRARAVKKHDSKFPLGKWTITRRKGGNNPGTISIKASSDSKGVFKP
jgi:hypothetical protein|tara:strand:+ start:982 stop:3078 length:2097 start_codon:yes stop_codon:yes gene_type:complete